MKVWQLAVASVIAATLAACEQKQPEPTAHADSNPVPAATESPAPVTMDPYATDPYASEPATAPPRSAAAQQPAAQRSGGKQESTLIAGSPGGRSHVVQKGDTLYGLARKYYNDQKRWKDIWDANRAVIPDKDRLTPGTRLVIP